MTEARRAAEKRLRSKTAAWAAAASETDAEEHEGDGGGTGDGERDGEGVDAASVRVPAISLRPPSERDVLADQAAAITWVREWHALAPMPGVDIDWVERRWPRAGTQRLPTRIRFASPDALATFVGGETARTWRRMRDRAERLRDAFGETAEIEVVVRRFAEQLRSYDDERFDTVVRVASWLVANPLERMRPRQLPIRGVDSKWFGDHRAIVTALHAAAASTPLSIVENDPLVRVRVLDPTLELGRIAELAAPLDQLSRLEYRPAAVFIFENLESVLAMPPWPGAIVVHGSGFAVGQMPQIPWIMRVPVLYWGDLDASGFAILHQLRHAHPDVTSVLMDDATLFSQRDLWVGEPTPPRGDFHALTAAERHTLAHLRREGDVRLEQERIPWATALEGLQTAWDATTIRDTTELPRHH